MFFGEHCDEILSFAQDYQRDVSIILCQIYSQLCGGFKHILRQYGLLDLIVSPLILEAKVHPAATAAPSKNIDVEMLKEMGFTKEQAIKALELSNNSFDAALELLLN